uniref:Cyclin N-terminal domain-containing protein n=1 Tax=Plectus sambesii TaxID=2011161 RepID=A0A914WAG2_9BILA
MLSLRNRNIPASDNSQQENGPKKAGDGVAPVKRNALFDKANRPALAVNTKESLLLDGSKPITGTNVFTNKTDLLKVPENEAKFRKPLTRANARDNGSDEHKPTGLVSRSSSFANSEKLSLKTQNGAGIDLDRLVRPTLTSLRRQNGSSTIRESIAVKKQPVEVKEDGGEESMVSADSTPILEKASYSTAMIPDIDAEDTNNPLQAADYVQDIYKYLFWLETRQPIREDFLKSYAITARMRSILTDWLVQVHLRFHLLSETLHMTVLLLDRFLQTAQVPKDQLQLVGVTCMFIASKYEEMYAPEISDFVYITDNTYTKREILRMEMKIFSTLKYNIGRPHSIHFLRRFSKAFGADAETHTLAKYLSEAALIEYSLCHLLPSEIAAAALWLAVYLRDQGSWDAKMVHYSRYSNEGLKETLRRLAKSVSKAHKGTSKLQAVRNKYSTTKFLGMANLSSAQLDKLDSIANS